MSSLIYCQCCEKQLRSYGDIAFELFKFICECYQEGTPMEVSSDIHESHHGYLSIIHFLESKGYLVTTESSENSLQVKPLGIHFNGLSVKDKPVFCIH